MVGYTEYYLAEKFRKETGLSVSRFIRYAKIERAKLLLEITGKTVKAISESLAFTATNSFIQSFRETTEYMSIQYREKFMEG